MFGGLNRPLATAVIAVAALVAPSAAFACNSGISAVNVYRECRQSGGGGKPTHTSHGHSGAQPGTPAATIPRQTVKALKKAGKDGKSLTKVVNGYSSVPRMLQLHTAAAAEEPTAVSSAFDLGSGPTVLLIVLAGTAILLLGVSGFRGVRRR